MIRRADDLPIKVETMDFPVSDEAIDLIASILLDAVERREREAGDISEG